MKKSEEPDEFGVYYNVGMISGGTSVNTIAQKAEMLYEYRSDSRRCLETMERSFFRILEQNRSAEVQREAEKIGVRPCAGDVDPVRQQALLERAGAAIRQVTGMEPVFRAGSTDCNAALGAGIPAVCIGGCIGPIPSTQLLLRQNFVIPRRISTE